MKISKMTTDEAADALVKMSEAVTAIVADEESVPLLNALSVGIEAEGNEGITAALMRLVPFLLKKHRKEFYTIIGALDGKEEEEIGKFNLLSTIRVVRDSFDKDLLDFFKSSGEQMQPGEGE